MGNHCGTNCQSEIQNEQEILEQQPSLISLKGKFKSKNDTTHDMSQFSNLNLILPIAHHPAPQKRILEQDTPIIRIPTDESDCQIESSKNLQHDDNNENQSIKKHRHRHKQFDELLQMKKAGDQSPRKRRKSSQQKSIIKYGSPKKDNQKSEKPDIPMKSLKLVKQEQEVHSPQKSLRKNSDNKKYRKYSDSLLQDSPQKSGSKRKISNQISTQLLGYSKQISEIQSPTKRHNKNNISNISYVSSKSQNMQPPIPILKRKDSEQDSQLSPRKQVRFQEANKKLRRGRSGMVQ